MPPVRPRSGTAASASRSVGGREHHRRYRRRRGQRNLRQLLGRRDQRLRRDRQPRRGQLHRHRRHRHARPSGTSATACASSAARGTTSSAARGRRRQPDLRQHLATGSRSAARAPNGNVVQGNLIGTRRGGDRCRSATRRRRPHRGRRGEQHDRRHRAGAGNTIAFNSQDGVTVSGGHRRQRHARQRDPAERPARHRPRGGAGETAAGVRRTTVARRRRTPARTACRTIRCSTRAATAAGTSRSSSASRAARARTFRVEFFARTRRTRPVGEGQRYLGYVHGQHRRRRDAHHRPAPCSSAPASSRASSSPPPRPTSPRNETSEFSNAVMAADTRSISGTIHTT